jgi:hypothetical protein
MADEAQQVEARVRKFVDLLKAAAQFAAIVGVVAGFWHISWIAGPQSSWVGSLALPPSRPTTACPTARESRPTRRNRSHERWLHAPQTDLTRPCERPYDHPTTEELLSRVAEGPAL